MKKISFVFLGLIIFSIFLYGVSVGTYKIFPYEEMDKLKQLLLDETPKINLEPVNYQNDINLLIHIKDTYDIEKFHKILIDSIWIQNDYPISKSPQLIESNISDSRYLDLKNLKQIDKFTFEMEYGINSISYLFIPEQSSGNLIIYHEGHAGDFINGKDTINYFLENNYTVLAFSMPLLGLNSQPIVEIDNIGKFKLTSHEHLRFLESSDFSPMKFFFEPITVSLNYLEKNYNFSSFNIVGLSGGGWTSAIYPAIDDRISHSYSVAGSLPIFLRTVPKNYGDYEQWTPTLYQKINYLDLYVMNSYGENRKFVQIFNKYDPCCFSGESFKIYEDEVKKSVDKLENGSFEIFLDDTHKRHQISPYALDLIKNSLEFE